MPGNDHIARHEELQFRRPVARPQLLVVLVGLWTFALFVLGQDPLGYVQAFTADGKSTSSHARLGHHTSGLEALQIPREVWLAQPKHLALSETEPAAMEPERAGARPASVEARSQRIFVPRGARLTDFHSPATLERSYATLVDSHARLMRALALCIFGIVASAALIFHLRRIGGQIQHSRELAALMAWCIGGLALQRLSLAFVPFSAGWLVLSAFVLPITLQLGRRVAVAAGLFLGLSCGALIPPFDPVIATVAITQALAVSTFMPRPRAASWTWSALICGSTCLLGTSAYATAQWICFGGFDPLDLVSLEWGRLGGVLVSGLVAPLLGLAINPLFERACGNLSRSKLLELSDLRNPLLQRIATRAPGTWAHSRMMANLAESAAHAVGADALLVRVGAYYHDLGKADEPEYFIENHSRGPGATNIHDRLAPEVSAAKIIAHVTEGVRRARAHGLPESIIDFMHTHHGSGRVEYFYQRARSAAEDPESIDPLDFTYPGDVPRTIENGILAIVDAVEAAARTLRNTDASGINTMLRQILFTKLASGQLDASGMSSRDIRLICDDLRESLLAASHERVAYPWQEDAKAEEEAAASSSASQSQPAIAAEQGPAQTDSSQSRPSDPSAEPSTGPSAGLSSSLGEADHNSVSTAAGVPQSIRDALTLPMETQTQVDANASASDQGHDHSHGSNSLDATELDDPTGHEHAAIVLPVLDDDSQALEVLARHDSRELDGVEMPEDATLACEVSDHPEPRSSPAAERLVAVVEDRQSNQSNQSRISRMEAAATGGRRVMATPPRVLDDITRPIPDLEPDETSHESPRGTRAVADRAQPRTSHDSEEREAAALDDKLNGIIDDNEAAAAAGEVLDEAPLRAHAALDTHGEAAPDPERLPREREDDGSKPDSWSASAHGS